MPSDFQSTLTNYARGLLQDRTKTLANFIAPHVNTFSAAGFYKAFDDKNAFVIYATDRAIGGEARRIEFRDEDRRYNCSPQALEIAIDDHERSLAGETDPLGIEQAKIETLLISAAVSHEDKVYKTVLSKVDPVTGVGNWSDPDVDPIKEINDQLLWGATQTGMLYNRMAIDIGSFNVLANHPKVLARQPGAALIGTTPEQIAKMTLNPGLDIRVGILSKDASKFGAGRNVQNIAGNNVLLFIGNDTPTLYDPSFAKTFVTQGGGVDAVRMYRGERNRSDILAIDWSEDIQVVSTLSGRRIAIS